MMMRKIIIHTFLITVLGVAVPGCWDRPLFTELATNRLEVRLMGTYASNDERPWDSPVAGDVNDDSIDDHPASADILPEFFKFDIAEMRLSGGGKEDAKFSIYRQTYTVPLVTTDIANNDNQHAFFTTGIVLDNDDPVPDRTYTHIKIYFRKMIFDAATRYELTADGWSAGEPTEVIFKENTTEGFDFNQLQTNYLYDAWRLEGDSTNRIFPLTIPIEGGLTFDNDTDKTVLEVRFVVKNFIKKYEYDRFDYTADNPFVAHFFGLSDWLRDVQPGDLQSGNAAIGGNIVAVARAYVPEETGTIAGTGPDGNYVIAIPADADILEYYVAGNLRNDNIVLCEPPRSPAGGGSISALLDYYLKLEKYKNDMNDFIDTCPGAPDPTAQQTAFETEWDAYNDAADNLKLPPLATVVSGGIYTLNNVPAGVLYDIYYSTSASYDYGTLFSTFTNVVNDISVTAGGTVNQVVP